MAYPTILLKQSNYALVTQNKTGDLAMVYKPLLNLVKNTALGAFTTENLKFDRYNALDMLILDEFDGSTNILINDDHNLPRLINSGFSVQEDNTFLVPEHYTNSVSNIYEDETLDLDTQLFKLYDTIPKVDFLGLEKGKLSCGSYVFYFRLADSVGNTSNIIAHSNIVQVFIGENGTYQIRMGMLDEDAGKGVRFKLSNLSSGFDYLRVYFERTSSNQSLAAVTSFFMIDLNFPVINNECEVYITGGELMMQISLSDIKNEYADIASCKTHACVDNTLFLANTSGFVHDYKALQKIAWCIYPKCDIVNIELPSVLGTTDENTKAKGYYDPQNVYNKVGYWPDEYYRFGIVFIYNNNLLSPAFSILGYDFQKTTSMTPLALADLLWNKNKNTYDFFDSEPDDYLFNKSIMSNSKGVVRFPRQCGIDGNINVTFSLQGIELYIEHTQDLRDAEKDRFVLPGGGYDAAKFLSQYHGIKGFFFVRQKRIPTVLAQGLVIGLTKKEHGSIPVLKNNTTWATKSFLSKGRLLLATGSNVEVPSENVFENKALLVPDAELQEATFNLIFTSQEFCLYKTDQQTFTTSDGIDFMSYSSSSAPDNEDDLIVKLTAIQTDTKLKTNGVDYFSSLAGSAEEPYKTEDVKNVWNKTAPQKLTVSTSLIRGRWGYYVGMSDNSFNFGDVVNIKSKEFYTKGELQNTIEFLTRFVDASMFSPISERHSVFSLASKDQFTCYGGDCFPSMFTHRMMANFTDPEMPTNTKVINPSCWCENYAVRCTAEILSDTHSNLTGDSGGFFIPSPADKTSNIVSLVFGVLTGNLGTVINAAKKLQEDPKPIEQREFANEVATAFEIYTGNVSPSSESYKVEDDDWYENGEWAEMEDDTLQQAAKSGKIKKVNPRELEKSASGFSLKALFKSDDKWEMHGTALINRADVNAVSFGQWITFPVRSSMNLALRDIDFYQATEEAKFNKKRAFFPLEKRDITNRLLDSNVINGAAKKTIHKNIQPAYKTVPFIKLEYFNRIYWSKPNVSDSFLNSFRMIYRDQYKEYNKELGTITKIVPIANNLLVVFTHGLGILPIDRSIKTEAEASPYLASRNVLPAQVQTISKDFGSMWKNSVLQTPKGIVYGVDTVGKKIWRTQGSQVEFISDHYVSKFLNDFIDLSEFDYKAYQGHLDVKTHYNNFKNDVIFTLTKDIPTYLMPNESKLNELRTYILDVWGSGKLDDVIYPVDIKANALGNASFDVIFGHVTGVKLDNTYTVDDDGNIKLTGYEQQYDEDGNLQPVQWTGIYEDYQDYLQLKTAEIQNGKIYINDIFSGIWCDIEKWDPGTIWSLCYNEVLGKWITFYDWYPVESCNVDNIYFSFDQERIDDVYNNTQASIHVYEPKKNSVLSNKYFIDQTFTDTCKVYDYTTYEDVTWPSGFLFASYYCEKGSYDQSLAQNVVLVKDVSKEWEFRVIENTGSDLSISGVVTLIKFFNLPLEYLLPNSTVYDWISYAADQTTDEKEHLLFYGIRDYNPNRMYLWKHGQAGIYDNQGKIKPTHWYGNQHEFNFEFVVNDTPIRQKVFNNLKILSNKVAPDKFEYEVVGEGYEWFEFKPIVEWINRKAVEENPTNPDYDKWFRIVLNKTSRVLSATYYDFPILFDLDRVIKRLPYLKMKHTDKKGTPERPHYKWDGGKNYWSELSSSIAQDKYSYNCSEACLIQDDQMNEVRIRTESLGNDMKKYGRLRGNMLYLEDLWDVEIRPIQITWCYLPYTSDFKLKKVTETKHRDKYIKVKIRYSGEDLAVVLLIYTIFDESFA